MKKMSKQARSIWLNALVILFTLGLVLYLGASAGDLGDAWNTLRAAKAQWIVGAVISWCVFMCFEAMGLHVFFVQQKLKVKYRVSLLVALIGSFYSNITPAATGGQPMQVFALKKRGVPTGISSSALAVKFFTFQVALLTMGGLLWVTHPQMVHQCIDQGRWIVLTGFIINGLAVVAVLLLAINKNIVRAILTFAIWLGKKLRLIKDAARTTSKADAAMNDFHASVDMLTHHPLQLLCLLLVAVFQVLGLMSITYCIYRALGLSAMGYLEILTLQFLLYIAASFTPLPGASGAQEGGFYIFFQQVIPTQNLMGALLLWRFFTYYFTLLLGFASVFLDGAIAMRRQKREGASQAMTETEGAQAVAEENSESTGHSDARASGHEQEAEGKD